MARQLVFELASGEARALLLTASERRIQVEKSLTIPLNRDEDAETPTPPEELVVEALNREGMSRVEAIAVVGRSDIELRLLSVPPAPDAELPNLVRFQAVQELPHLGSDAPLDYLPLDEPVAGEPRRVLAAVLKPDAKKRFEKIAHDAKLTLDHIVLRSAASASLMLQQKPALQQDCCLLIEIMGRHAELAAVHHGRVVFLRHMLLAGDPGENTEAADSLLAEVRRTRVVVANQEQAETVEPMVLVRLDQQRDALAERFRSELDSPVELIEPLPDSLPAAKAREIPEEQRDRFAALLGAVADDAAERPPALDFLHPRQAPKPTSRRNRYAAIGLTVACLVLVLIGINRYQAWRVGNQIQDLQKKAANLDRKLKDAEKTIDEADALAEWRGKEAVWIEELRWLSEQLPEAKDARLTSLTLGSMTQGKTMSLKGGITEQSRGMLDDKLRDDEHRFVPKRMDDTRIDPKYPFAFESSVEIESQ